MILLHFRRTFVEKLFAIHAKVEIVKRTGEPLGAYARHYYDLYCLAERPEVLTMLRSKEYEEIKADYAMISQEFYRRDSIPPPGMRFAKSDALFPADQLGHAIAQQYEEHCRFLCYGRLPTWPEVRDRFADLRTLL